ncbi:MAG: hypothetical protein ACR2GU_14265 [Rubrobacteraceae bacterium]
MSLTHDYIHQRRGYRIGCGCCRVRIYCGAEGDAPVVLCTELPEGSALELAELAGSLAAEVVREHFPDGLPDLARPLLWIEVRRARRSGRKRYALLTFSSYAPRIAGAGFVRRVTLGTPEREPLTPAEVASLTSGE